MERKYWVPALERADAVLKQIAAHPSKMKLTDLTAATGINKSTMFSLLQTMESLGWLKREKGDTYSLGSAFAVLGNAYFSSNSLIELFMEKAAESVRKIGEAVQLAKLDFGDVLYLAKKEASAAVRLISEPGMRIPAYATGLGKVLLSSLEDSQIRDLYPQGKLHSFTPSTLPDTEALIAELHRVRSSGLGYDREEIVPGFTCVAAPVFDRQGRMAAAVSFSMPTHQWQAKEAEATGEIQALARALMDSM